MLYKKCLDMKTYGTLKISIFKTYLKLRDI